MLNTVSSKLIVKWFMIGLTVRLGLAVIVILLAWHNWENVFLYFVDLPTVFCIFLVENLVSTEFLGQLMGRDPYYIPMNVFAGVLWGSLFVLVRLIVVAVRSKLSAAKSP